MNHAQPARYNLILGLLVFVGVTWYMLVGFALLAVGVGGLLFLSR